MKVLLLLLQILWVSVSNDLRLDAVRDLADVDGDKDGILVHPKVRCLQQNACGSPVAALFGLSIHLNLL